MLHQDVVITKLITIIPQQYEVVIPQTVVFILGPLFRKNPGGAQATFTALTTSP